jgi:predicted metallopeptidase
VHVKPARKLQTWEFGNPVWLKTGKPDIPFDFCHSLKVLCEDVVSRCEAFFHIDPNRLLFAVTRARSRSLHGLQARVTPLRFPGGRLVEKRGRITYQIQRYFHGATEFLYLVTFCLPRFLDQDFDEKLITIFHELYHISPNFDGDLRRHEGRYSLHTRSKRAYDQHMAQLVREYLSKKPDASLFHFLRLNSQQLQHRHGSIQAVIVPHPKIIPVAAKNNGRR